MGNFIKYLIYVILVIAAIFILKGLWDGEMMEHSSVEQEKKSAEIQESNSVQ